MRPKPTDPARRKPRPQPAATPPAKDARPVERWVVFEQGKCAHLMREDDLFPAERTLCGIPALNADWHPLPHLNSQPADYVRCRGCRAIASRTKQSRPDIPLSRKAGCSTWTPTEAIDLILREARGPQSASTATTVYLYLLTTAQKSGCDTFPVSIRRVAEMSSISVPKAKKAVVILVAAGVLRVTRQSFAGRHLGTANFYTLLGKNHEGNLPLIP